MDDRDNSGQVVVGGRKRRHSPYPSRLSFDDHRPDFISAYVLRDKTLTPSVRGAPRPQRRRRVHGEADVPRRELDRAALVSVGPEVRRQISIACATASGLRDAASLDSVLWGGILRQSGDSRWTKLSSRLTCGKPPPKFSAQNEFVRRKRTRPGT